MMSFNNQIDFLTKVMDVSALKRKTNADNIANYNTPKFKAAKVEFDQLFDDKTENLSLKTTNGKHIESTFGNFGNTNSIQVVKDTTTKERADGNNVDLNLEMIDAIKNNYVYSLGVQALNNEFNLNKLAMGK